MAKEGIYSLEEIDKIVNWSKKYAHISADRVLLGSSDIPTNYRIAVAQQRALTSSLDQKLPTWSQASVYVPQGINLEQATSEPCALYKQRYISSTDTLLDMTGGLAVDFVALASRASRAIYTEQNPETYQAAVYNLPLLLGTDTCYTALQCDSLAELSHLLGAYSPTILYIDPARREEGQSGRRVYAIEDCSPNLYEVLHLISAYRGNPLPRLLIKLSPMLDIKHTLTNLSSIIAVDIVALRGEVKELLLHLDLNTQIEVEQIPLRAVNLHPGKAEQMWTGTLQAEGASSSIIATTHRRYLYEPNAAVMKSGLYKLLGEQFSLEKLSQHTHLYTSNELIIDFPGKIYEILTADPFSSSLVKQIQRQSMTTMIATRNFPLSTEALRQKLRSRDGGDGIIWGVRIGANEPWLLQCRRIQIDLYQNQ